MPLPADHPQRMERVRLSLAGLSVGDAFGERFFVAPTMARSLMAQRAVPQSPWNYTDDTAMALSIVEILERFGQIDQEALAERFAQRYAAEPDRGYGGMAHRILTRIGQGEPWAAVSYSAFDGMGSMGNGGAMRAAPVGAYFAGNLAEACEQARRSAEVTHAHPEGQAGAAAVAVAAAAVADGMRQPAGIFTAVLDTIPPGDTRDGIAKAAAFPLSMSVDAAASQLGNGTLVISQDTVPFSLWCALRHLGDFTDAMWSTVSGLGDRDTTCAIVGGIVALAVGVEGIPADWRAARETLDGFE